MEKSSKQPEYQVWSQIKQRCRNIKCKKYKSYGGRGIEMCDRWYDSYQSFIDDMGNRPDNKHTLDRINNDGNYEPGNCRWVTSKIQNLNKRTTAIINPGDVFGKLTIIGENESKIRNIDGNHVRRYFQVRCECGREKSIRLDNLRQRKNQSCGERSCNKYGPITIN
jgi:hypothetical protein